MDTSKAPSSKDRIEYSLGKQIHGLEFLRDIFRNTLNEITSREEEERKLYHLEKIVSNLYVEMKKILKEKKEKFIETIKKLAEESGVEISFLDKIYVSVVRDEEYDEIKQKLKIAEKNLRIFQNTREELFDDLSKLRCYIRKLDYDIHEKNTFIEKIKAKMNAFEYLNTLVLCKNMNFSDLSKETQDGIKTSFKNITENVKTGCCGTCFEEKITTSVFGVGFCDTICMNRWLHVYFDFLKFFKNCGLLTYFVNYPADAFIIAPFKSERMRNPIYKWLKKHSIPMPNVRSYVGVDVLHNSVFERVLSLDGSEEVELTPIEFLASLYIKKRFEAESDLHLPEFTGFHVETGDITFIKVSGKWKPVPYFITRAEILLKDDSCKKEEDTFEKMFHFNDQEENKKKLYQVIEDRLKFGPGSTLEKCAKKDFEKQKRRSRK